MQDDFHDGHRVSANRETGLSSPVSLRGETYPDRQPRRDMSSLQARLEEAQNAQQQLRQHWPMREGATEQRYWRQYCKIIKSKAVSMASRPTVRSRRAAFRYGLERIFVSVDPSNISGLLRTFGEVQAFEREVVRGGDSPDIARQIEDSGFHRFAPFLRARGISVSGPPGGRFPRRKGRVQQLKRLPTGWRETLLAAVHSRIPDMLEALTCLALLGCRPDELPSASIERTDNEELQLTVESGKSLRDKETNVGVVRGAIYKINSASRILVDLAQPEDSCLPLPFAHINPKQIENTIRRISLKVFPDLRPPISPYCFRNQLASDLKRAGVGAEELALILGHITDEQQKSYGRARYGSSAATWLPIRILPSHPVRLDRASRYPRDCSDDQDRDGEDYEPDDYDGDF